MRTAAADVQDDGQVRVRALHVVDDALDVGAGKDVKVLRREVAGPRVEDLHRLRAAVRLQTANQHTRNEDTTTGQPAQLVVFESVVQCPLFLLMCSPSCTLQRSIFHNTGFASARHVPQ